MNEEAEAMTYVAALEGKLSATEWTLVTLGAVSVCFYVFAIAWWLTGKC